MAYECGCATELTTAEGMTPSSGQRLSIGTTTKIVQYLLDSWQVPNDKRVMMISEGYPLKTFGAKGSSKMVEEYLKSKDFLKERQLEEKDFGGKEDHEGGETSLSYKEFERLLLGEYVCAWAECRRGRE